MVMLTMMTMIIMTTTRGDDDDDGNYEAGFWVMAKSDKVPTGMMVS